MVDSSLAQRISGGLRNSVTFKMFVIGFLILIMLIPTSMVESLIWERKSTKTSAVQEISSKWGDVQTITGPVLTVPYKSYYTKQDGTRGYNVRNAYFLPKQLIADGDIQPEIRYRGIYKAILYTSKLNFTGYFERPEFSLLNIAEKNVLWGRAYFSIGVSDMAGIRNKLDLLVNNKAVQVGPGVTKADFLDSGVSSRLNATLVNTQRINFKFRLELNGNQQLYVVPVGETTNVKIKSPWPSPSFVGNFLPKDRTVSEAGFTAEWRVLHLNRNYPQSWTGKKMKLQPSAFGVKLFEAADVYQQATRTVKYAMLFVLLTFTTFFFTEITGQRRLHPVQYLLIGFSLVIFYSLLIAISEHLRFSISYLIASVAVIGLITGYSKWVLANNRMVAMVAGILVILYGYLYMILQLEDYALLAGSIGLFVALALVMYITRKIDWYAVSLGEEQ